MTEKLLNFSLTDNICCINFVLKPIVLHPNILTRFDPHATQFITFNQMSDFIGSLDPPLGIPKPNSLAIVSFDLPIAKVMVAVVILKKCQFRFI